MKTIRATLLSFALLVSALAAPAHTSAQSPDEYPANYAREPRFKALVYYTTEAESAHVDFALRGVEFFKRLNYGDGFVLDVATDQSEYPYERLREYSIVVMLNGYPTAPEERAAFEEYMEGGGGWMGFHAAAYNDPGTGWPWFVDFLGQLASAACEADRRRHLARRH